MITAMAYGVTLTYPTLPYLQMHQKNAEICELTTLFSPLPRKVRMASTGTMPAQQGAARINLSSGAIEWKRRVLVGYPSC